MLVLDLRKLPQITELLGSREELQVLVSMMLTSVFLSPGYLLPMMSKERPVLEKTEEMTHL